ncbi:uncharacterized protein PITG_22130 [Phytophthora infestans T30-4]|uniref:Uncharacterized protein n=1 Tax=Phytophthora infestans (strain T30-4) TaxID=403677 RepID=D0P4Y3_PHYIT|nr:uncharacterized protein PITG_22130 [Phytophthora infestans T30-4]EEY54631.1 conserved hypothetical protein [Phytophthora infestans T30-4]|eukprot:XP_002894716.1 conserved hypothetical protein [Phytophthora infestans T30-4]
MDITVNIVQTPAMLLVADFAGDRQTTGAALGMAWATLGAILIAGYIEFFGAAYKTLHWFMGMLSVTMFICVGHRALESRKHAFASVYHGIRALPTALAIYWVAFFFVQYGYTAYNGNKGQLFGLQVYGGVVAGGRADLLYNIVGYVGFSLSQLSPKCFTRPWHGPVAA